MGNGIGINDKEEKLCKLGIACVAELNTGPKDRWRHDWACSGNEPAAAGNSRVGLQVGSPDQGKPGCNGRCNQAQPLGFSPLHRGIILVINKLEL